MNKPVRSLTAVLLLAPLLAGCAGGNKSLGEVGDAASLLGLVGARPELSTLASLVRAAGIGDLLSGSDPLTLLAPSNAAFQKLGRGTLDSLMQPENKGQLADILKNHVISGSRSSNAMLAGSALPSSLLGNAFEVARTAGGQMTLGGATVTAPNLEASNGYVHVIDQVLLP